MIEALKAEEILLSR